MGAEIPDLSEDEFRERLAGFLPAGAPGSVLPSLYAHFQELRRWNRRVALVGGGLAVSVVERLFGESLAALELIPESAGCVLDVGSGAGFPGLVIAAARPGVRVVLVEPRGRKWAFLRSAAERASLSCDCLNARVSAALPQGIPESVDRVTVRGLRLGAPEIEALASRLAPGGAFLIWAGPGQEAPACLRQTRALALGPGRGSIRELVPA